MYIPQVLLCILVKPKAYACADECEVIRLHIVTWHIESIGKLESISRFLL